MMTSTLEEELFLQVDAARVPLPEREVRFHPTRKWRFDFYWPDLMVAVEVEGGIWVRGRHNRPASFIKDCEKYNEAALMGITVLRVTDKQIKDGSALDWIRRAVDGRKHIPVGSRRNSMGSKAP